MFRQSADRAWSFSTSISCWSLTPFVGHDGWTASLIDSCVESLDFVWCEMYSQLCAFDIKIEPHESVRNCFRLLRSRYNAFSKAARCLSLFDIASRALLAGAFPPFAANSRHSASYFSRRSRFACLRLLLGWLGYLRLG